MINIMTSNEMAQNRGIGSSMSACGHAFVPAARVAAPATGAFAGVTYVATAAAQVKGQPSLRLDGEVRTQVRIKGAVSTGTNAWRPPTT